MMTVKVPPDQSARDRAVDPTRSFIVRAPAGSGKTGLLTLRFLKLLAIVDEPEQVVAVTFTRKAAAEMLERVTAALASVSQVDDELPLHQRAITDAASAVIKRSRERSWQLELIPKRLKILTIDALAASIVSQGVLPTGHILRLPLSEDLRDVYREAIHLAMEDFATHSESNGFDKGAGEATTFHMLMDAFDNRFRRTELRLLEAIDDRYRVLDLLSRYSSETEFEADLARLIQSQSDQVAVAISSAQYAELKLCLEYALEELNALEGSARHQVLQSIPVAVRDVSTAQWCAIAKLVLTATGAIKQRVTKRDGFPTKRDATRPELANEMKARMTALLNELTENDHFVTCLSNLVRLPIDANTADIWHQIEAFRQFSHYLIANLRLRFEANGRMDFSELQQSAIAILGDETTGLDVALAMDYRIHHLLVDEVQDTSTAQYQLIEKITDGWDQSSNKTLFLVGDPMQSIYRFRHAEYQLFLRAINESRVGSIPLEVVELTANFRSRPGLVNWWNRNARVFLPEHKVSEVSPSDLSPRLDLHWMEAVGMREANEASAVHVHAFAESDEDKEVTAVVDVVAAELGDVSIQEPKRIAVLARAKSHLTEIGIALTAAGIRWHGVEIEPLVRREVVNDLCTLVRALLYPLDDLAWLAMLRAPWCGVSLVTLGKSRACGQA